MANVTYRSCDNGESGLLCPNGVDSTTYDGITYTCCDTNNCNRHVKLASTQVISCYSGTSLVGYSTRKCATASKFCMVKKKFNNLTIFYLKFIVVTLQDLFIFWFDDKRM
jgi:hypothetical protein